MTTTKTKEQKIVNAYLYSRVSSGSQKKGVGLTRQDEKGVQICKEKGWVLQPDNLSDVGSAYTGENILKGDLGRFITAAKEGRLKPYPVLILEQWDRFSRQDLDTSFDEARKLLKCGVAIHIGFAGGKTFTEADLQDIASRVSMEISFQQAWEYSHNLSRRVNDAFQRKYQQALNGKPIQLGYWQPAWIDFIGQKKQVGKFQRNDVADMVETIVDDYLNGKSMMWIANRLNSEKVPCIGRKTKKGKQWSQGQVAYLLRTPTLVGTITINGNTFDHYYPPVISDEKWKLLQDKLANNTGKKGGTREGEWISNLFPNRVKCSVCGGTITTQNGKCGKVVQRYYKCLTARIHKDKCQVRKMVEINKIEEDFFLLFFKKDPAELLGKHTVEHQSELAKVNEQIRILEKQENDASELIGDFPVEAIRKKLKVIQTAKQTYLKAKEQILQRITTSDNAPQTFINIRKALLKVTDEIGDLDKAADQLIENLKKPEIRRKMVQMLPTLIDHLTIDLEKGIYSVTSRDGKTSSWRDVYQLPTIE